MPPPDRQPGLVERLSEPLEEHGAARGVVPQQAHAPVAAGEAERGDLVVGDVAGARDDELEHRGGAVGGGGLGDERLGRVAVRAADRDLPVALEAGHEARQGVEPVRGAGGGRLAADGRRGGPPRGGYGGPP